MARNITEYRSPDRCVVGTVGMPGERTFYIQVRQDQMLTSVACEKQQASVLAERIDQLLAQVESSAEFGAQIRSAHESVQTDDEPLEMPLIEEFRVGAMALGWDDSANAVVIELHAIAIEGEDVPDIAEDDGEGPDTVRIWLLPAQARAFATRGIKVVEAGRPPCPFCQQPLDPSGHICPRANGYRRRDF